MNPERFEVKTAVTIFFADGGILCQECVIDYYDQIGLTVIQDDPDPGTLIFFPWHAIQFIRLDE